MRVGILVGVAAVLVFGFTVLKSADTTTNAERNRSFTCDSGVVPLNQSQSLIGLLVPAIAEQDPVSVRSTKIQYAEGQCQGGLCKHVGQSEAISDPVVLAIGEGVSDTVALGVSSSGVRLSFTSNSQNVRCSGHIIDTVSGTILSSFSWGMSQTGT